MSSVTSRISRGAIEQVLEGIDGIEFGWGGLDEPGPQTESSIERGFRLAGPVDDEWGRSENLDPENVGDIADEGAGHRG
jgi:hypothetical protein